MFVIFHKPIDCFKSGDYILTKGLTEKDEPMNKMEPKSRIHQKTSTVAFLVFQHKDQRKEIHLTENDNGGDGEEKLWQCRCRPDWFR